MNLNYSKNARPLALTLCLAVVAGCPGGDADDGDDTSVSTESEGSTVGDPTGGPTTGDPTTGDPTTGDPTTGDPTTGDPTGGETGLDPSCADVPEAADGSALDLGGWMPALSIDSQGEWQGACIVTAVEAGSTSLDCSADADGPPSIAATWTPAEAAPPWQVDDTVDVAYFFDGWNDGEYFAMRATVDGGLLLGLGYGGGDGGLPQFDELAAPITYDEDLDACGMPGEGQRFPAAITFSADGGAGQTLMQGDTVVLSGAGGESYQLTLHTAEAGDLGSDHYGSFYDVVVERQP